MKMKQVLVALMLSFTLSFGAQAAMITNGGFNANFNGWDPVVGSDFMDLQILPYTGSGMTPVEGSGFLNIVSPDFGDMPNGISQNIGNMMTGESLLFEYQSIGGTPTSSNNFFTMTSNGFNVTMEELDNQIIPEGLFGWSLFEFEAPSDINNIVIEFKNMGSIFPDGALLVDNLRLNDPVISSVPEPSTWLLLAAGVLGISALKRKPNTA